MINGDSTRPALWMNIQATFRFGLHLSLNTILRDKNIAHINTLMLVRIKEVIIWVRKYKILYRTQVTALSILIFLWLLSGAESQILESIN